jgi:hypothetical protein
VRKMAVAISHGRDPWPKRVFSRIEARAFPLEASRAPRLCIPGCKVGEPQRKPRFESRRDTQSAAPCNATIRQMGQRRGCAQHAANEGARFPRKWFALPCFHDGRVCRVPRNEKCIHLGKRTACNRLQQAVELEQAVPDVCTPLAINQIRMKCIHFTTACKPLYECRAQIYLSA